MRIYINDVEVTEAFNSNTDGAMGVIDSLTFQVPNIHLLTEKTTRDNWESYIDDDEIIITALSDTDGDLLFKGSVVRVGNDTPLSISCQSILNKLTWYQVPDDSSNFKLFQGNVGATPIGTSIECIDSEGGDPVWENDQWNGKYCIVSDSTLGTSNNQLGEEYVEIRLDSGTYTAFIVGETMTGDTSEAYGTVHSIHAAPYIYYYVLKNVTGTFQNAEDVTGSVSGDGTIDAVPFTQTCSGEIASYYGNMYRYQYYWNYIGNSKSTDFHEAFTNLSGEDMNKVDYAVNLKKYTIPKTADLQRMEISAYWEVRAEAASGSGLPDTSFNYDLVFSDDSGQNVYVIKSYSVTFDGTSETLHVGSLDEESFGIGWQHFKYFNYDGDHWTDGHFGFQVRGMNSVLSTFKVRLFQFNIKIYFDTDTFDIINVPITDTVATETLTTDTNFQTEGVAINDTVAIGETMTQAYANVYTSVTTLPTLPPYEIIGDINKGIATVYAKVLGYKLWTSLCNVNGFEYCMLNSHTLTAGLFEDFIYDGGTLTGFNDVEDIETSNNKYGQILINWSGKSDGENPAIIDTGNLNLKSIQISRPDILTEAEAISAGNDLIGKYENFRRSIKLEWGIYQDIRVGYRYDFTIYGVTYTDQICRRRTYTFNGGVWRVTGYFGGGHSPDEENIARRISLIKESITDTEVLTTTETYTPVNSHNSLSGINAGDNFEHITQTEKDDLHDHSNISVLNGITTVGSGDIITDLERTAYDAAIGSLGEDPTPSLSGNLELNLKGLVIEISHSVSEGNLVYMNGTVPTIADADSSSTMPAIGISLGTTSNQIMTHGVYTPGGTPYTAGSIYYVGLSGQPTTTRPTGNNDQVQRIGIAISTSKLMIIISPDVLTIIT